MASPSSPGVEFDDIDWKRQEDTDREAMRNLMAQMETGDVNLGESVGDTFKKHEEAIDYGDLSDDDDLPEEEDATGGEEGPGANGDVPGLTDDAGTSNDTDDLFGENGDFDSFDADDLFGESREGRAPVLVAVVAQVEPEEDLRELNFPGIYSATNQDPDIPAPAETTEELLKQSWPGFEKNIRLNFNQLLPPKSAHYIPKVPLKDPKPLNPTKVSLELAPDQEKAFRSATSTSTTTRKRGLEAEARGLVYIDSVPDNVKIVEEDFDWTPASQLEPVGGFSFADIEVICADWDNINPPQEPFIVEEPKEDLDDWDREILGYSSKRQKTTKQEVDFMNVPRFTVPSFDDFEIDTRRIGKRVLLDLNDPYLLVDTREQDLVSKRQRLGLNGGFQRTGKSGLSSRLSARFNYSNDEAYDMLKENHQNKIRATIGNPAVEHSMPALKLQWPYYLVKLSTKDARVFHRPPLKFNKFLGLPITFSKPGLRKKKTFKNMSTQEIFQKSKDLSLQDHYSAAALLEYSEEHPTVLSNFGMGNRIINYYRRKNPEDPERPQPDDKVGDAQILLPEDKSPFSNFGMVDPGETARAIHNGMYRAPIFKHDPKATDFLVIRSSTGVEGTTWHIRNIDHLFAVGQQFPSTEVPGPHSRRVTNAVKNRMKMIAYRKIRHSPHQNVRIGEVTKHIEGSDDSQLRQKLKEFIVYDKTEKVWKMPDNQIVPEEATIRSMVKPEEVCLIDAMQVGARQLADAGLEANDEDEDEQQVAGKVDKAEKPEENTIEHKLAPWETSKAFLEASADKAMLQLHGDGDPSGHGLAFSFIKTSMKGGYIGAVQGPNATSAAAIEAERKANGGHTYNVKKQQGLYNDAIREIWEKQKKNLSDTSEVAQNDAELDDDEDERQNPGATPFGMDEFDDSASQFSMGNGRRRTMRIVRQIRSEYGTVHEEVEIVKDPRIWKEYLRRRSEIDAEKTNVYEVMPTGNAELDREKKKHVEKELARLNRNKERRRAREKLKGRAVSPDGSVPAGSPSGTPAATPSGNAGGGGSTSRKCANCGQVGHIKTNKKLCPMLNGTKTDMEKAPSSGFGAVTNFTSGPPPPPPVF